ncbi:MAG: M28 family peptidase [Candidatus Marinimicrobia bacterium]|nr:M28 family peptidase [Candidatus Neomarinimicrobiota bacterium]
MKNIIISVLTILLVWNCTVQPELISEKPSPSKLGKHIAYLASDELTGRKPGTAGGMMAAEYIRDQFQKYGLVLLAEEGFQQFSVITDVEAGQNNRLEFTGYSGTIAEDFTPLSFSASSELSAPVVCVGYGIEFNTDSLSHNDYENVVVKDSWVLVFRGDPELDDPKSPYLPFSSLRSKVITAVDNDAAGVIFVSGPEFDKQDDLIDLHYEGGLKSAAIPVIQIKRSVADSLLLNSGKTVADLEQELNQNRDFKPLAIDVIVSAAVEISKTKAQTRNVIGLLSANSENEEYIIIGAHYDHLGMGGVGSGSRRPDTLAIHNGADDNASGSAGLLRLAELLSARRDQLTRNILFISFGAEEMGLLGSKHYISEPVIDLAGAVMMVNLDMLGNYYTDSTSLSIGGTGTAIGLADIITGWSESAQLSVSQSPEGYGPSDHASFYGSDLPVLFFFTGAHDRYHTPFDDVEYLNIAGEELIIDNLVDLIQQLANNRDELVFQEAGPKTRTSYRRRFKVTLGIMPDHAAEGITGLRIDLTIPERPAAIAGMKKGDIIVAMEGKPVGDIYEYMHRLSEFKVGQRISVEIMRDGKKHILIVDL